MTERPPPALSVVIPTHQRASSLRVCLDALAAQTRLDFEVVVVCDGGDAETRAVEAQYQSQFPITWRHLVPAGGLSKARNTGANCAQASLLLFLDDDMSATPACVAEHLALHSKITEPIVACGRIEEEYAAPPGSFSERCLRDDRAGNVLRGRRELESGPQSGWSMAVYCGNNCSIRTPDFLATKHDEELGCHEEMELGARLHLQGVRFVPADAAVAIHRSSKDLQRTHATMLRHACTASMHRVLHKNQLIPQTRGAAQFSPHGQWAPWKRTLALRSPGAVALAAACCNIGADTFRSRLLFDKWKALQAAATAALVIRSEPGLADELEQLPAAVTAILAFHGITGNDPGTDRRRDISPAHFVRLLSRLQEAGVEGVSSSELHLPRVNPACALTFDDGYEDFYIHGAPALSQYRMRATIYVVAGRIGRTNDWKTPMPGARNLMNAAQLRELHAAGFDIGCHSWSHADLTSVSDTDLRHEIIDARHSLEDLLGAAVHSFAYPYGFFDARVVSMVAKAGFANAVTTLAGQNQWEDPFVLRRLEIAADDRASDVHTKILSGRSRWQEMRRTTRTHARRVLAHVGLMPPLT